MPLNQIYLPPLIVDNAPKVLHNMTLMELRTFLPQMLKAALGVPETQPFSFSEHPRPKWWPKEMQWCSQFYDLIPKTEDRSCYLRHVVTACYMHHLQEDTLYLFDAHPNESPRWRLEQREDNKSWVLLRAEDDTPIWYFSNTFKVVSLLALQAQQQSIRKSVRKRKPNQRYSSFDDSPAKNTRRGAPIGAPSPGKTDGFDDNLSIEAQLELLSSSNTPPGASSSTATPSLNDSSFCEAESRIDSPTFNRVSIFYGQPLNAGVKRQLNFDSGLRVGDRLPEVSAAHSLIVIECAKCNEKLEAGKQMLEHELRCFAATRKQQEKAEFLGRLSLLPKAVYETVKTQLATRKRYVCLSASDPSKPRSEAEITFLSKIPFSSMLGRLVHGFKEASVNDALAASAGDAIAKCADANVSKLRTRSDSAKCCKLAAVFPPLPFAAHDEPCVAFDEYAREQVAALFGRPASPNDSNDEDGEKMSSSSVIAESRGVQTSSHEASPGKHRLYPIVYRPQRIIRHYHTFKLTNTERHSWWRQVRYKGLNRASYRLYKQLCKPVEIVLPPKIPRSVYVKFWRTKLAEMRAAKRSQTPPQPKRKMAAAVGDGSVGGSTDVRKLKPTRSIHKSIAFGVKRQRVATGQKASQMANVLSYRHLHSGNVDSSLFKKFSSRQRSGVRKPGDLLKSTDLLSSSQLTLTPPKASRIKRSATLGAVKSPVLLSQDGPQRTMKRVSPNFKAISLFCQSQPISLVSIALPSTSSVSEPSLASTSNLADQSRPIRKAQLSPARKPMSREVLQKAPKTGTRQSPIRCQPAPLSGKQRIMLPDKRRLKAGFVARTAGSRLLLDSLKKKTVLPSKKVQTRTALRKQKTKETVVGRHSGTSSTSTKRKRKLLPALPKNGEAPPATKPESNASRSANLSEQSETVQSQSLANEPLNQTDKLQMLQTPTQLSTMKVAGGVLSVSSGDNIQEVNAQLMECRTDDSSVASTDVQAAAAANVQSDKTLEVDKPTASPKSLIGPAYHFAHITPLAHFANRKVPSILRRPAAKVVPRSTPPAVKQLVAPAPLRDNFHSENKASLAVNNTEAKEDFTTNVPSAQDLPRHTVLNSASLSEDISQFNCSKMIPSGTVVDEPSNAQKVTTFRKCLRPYRSKSVSQQRELASLPKRPSSAQAAVSLKRSRKRNLTKFHRKRRFGSKPRSAMSSQSSSKDKIVKQQFVLNPQACPPVAATSVPKCSLSEAAVSPGTLTSPQFFVIGNSSFRPLHVGSSVQFASTGKSDTPTIICGAFPLNVAKFGHLASSSAVQMTTQSNPALLGNKTFLVLKNAD